VTTAEIEFAVSEGDSGPVLIDSGAVSATTKQFSNVEPGVESFARLDNISASQPVVVVTIPADQTATLLPGEPALEYQIRLRNPGDGERVTVVVGEISVEESPLE
jgi:hypothetical protein